MDNKIEVLIDKYGLTHLKEELINTVLISPLATEVKSIFVRIVRNCSTTGFFISAAAIKRALFVIVSVDKRFFLSVLFQKKLMIIS